MSGEVSRREYRWAAAVALVVVAFSTLPYAAGWNSVCMIFVTLQREQTVLSPSLMRGRRKVRTTQSTALPNGKMSARA